MSAAISAAKTSAVSLRVVLPGLMAAMLLVAACAGGGATIQETAAEVTANAEDAAARVEAGDDPDTTVADEASASALVVEQPLDDSVEELPSRIERPEFRQATGVETTSTTAISSSSISSSTSVPSSSAPTTSTASTSSSTTTAVVADQTASKPVSPVTTVAGPAGGVASLYQGFVGTLDRNQRIADPLGPPPATKAGVQPLTGVAGVVSSRPAAIVKVDNSPPARPQSGLNAADIVIEEEVEGGVTRFAAVFHSNSATVGPVRSARTTDISIINSYGSPLLMYSGANEVTEGLVRAQPTVQNRNAGTSSGYWRGSGRRAPWNLYTDTASHWASASTSAPPAQFSYRDPGQGVSTSAKNAVPASSFSVAYRASTAGWSWDGSAWLRTQGGSRHMTAAGQQVSAANVVVAEVREVPTGMVDASGSNVPEFVFVGAGNVTVFTDGKRIDGRWNKPSMALAPTLMSGGSVIELTPGRTWIQLVGEGKGLLR